MSGPATDREPVVADDEPAPGACIEIHEARTANVGGMGVARTLPRRTRRTVGPWCFADHFGPADVRAASMQIGPHPHIGLHTATWLLAGEVVHRDSLGSEQPIRPGQLNLMTAGRGVAHAEETPEQRVDVLEGVQLWIAQPDRTRNGDPAFAHHDDLPRAAFGDADATIFLGAIDGHASDAGIDVDIVGAELAFRGRGTVEVPVDPDFEHAVLTLRTHVTIDGHDVAPGVLAYIGTGRDRVDVRASAGEGTVLLLGGRPFGEQLLMWWNFVGRGRDEIARAYRDWEEGGSDRFGDVASALSRIGAPRPNWLPL